MFMMGGSLLTVAVLKLLGLISTGAFLTLMGGSYFVTNKSKPNEGAVTIKARKLFKIGWQGSAMVGLIVAGILIILFAFRLQQI